MAIPDLDALIADVERAHGEAGRGAGPDRRERVAPLRAAVALAGQLRGLADELVDGYVEHSRLQGCSWAQIGEVLGITRQAAQQRYGTPRGRYGPDEFAEEVCAAVTHMREAALRHRNNFIGTEHVLYGLLTGDNSAVRHLGSLGIPAESLRERARGSLVMGASQAVERIAWTPYTRKALVNAHELAAREESPICCRHLLLGLASLGRGSAATALAGASGERPAGGSPVRDPAAVRPAPADHRT
ncbi:Clp protease N-terminal domain-containing protein [Actinocorallia populi]|uniref:Clp protease N-terminal domain-containing protein n=1 Tax=Actinocorallia populi TaxID=2079200 RepID=UPI000D08838E|nr:Clp protease N-terminal domain-containing protein [Actinocorallia populi]